LHDGTELCKYTSKLDILNLLSRELDQVINFIVEIIEIYITYNKNQQIHIYIYIYICVCVYKETSFGSVKENIFSR
jgi:hypothetical protein